MARRAIRGTPTPIATPMAVLFPELKFVFVVVDIDVGDVDAGVLDGGMFMAEEDVVDDEALLVLVDDDWGSKF